MVYKFVGFIRQVFQFPFAGTPLFQNDPQFGLALLFPAGTHLFQRCLHPLRGQRLSAGLANPAGLKGRHRAIFDLMVAGKQVPALALAFRYAGIPVIQSLLQTGHLRFHALLPGKQSVVYGPALVHRAQMILRRPGGNLSNAPCRRALPAKQLIQPAGGPLAVCNLRVNSGDAFLQLRKLLFGMCQLLPGNRTQRPFQLIHACRELRKLAAQALAAVHQALFCLFGFASVKQLRYLRKFRTSQQLALRIAARHGHQLPAPFRPVQAQKCAVVCQQLKRLFVAAHHRLHIGLVFLFQLHGHVIHPAQGFVPVIDRFAPAGGLFPDFVPLPAKAHRRSIHEKAGAHLTVHAAFAGAKSGQGLYIRLASVAHLAKQQPEEGVIHAGLARSVAPGDHGAVAAEGEDEVFDALETNNVKLVDLNVFHGCSSVILNQTPAMRGRGPAYEGAVCGALAWPRTSRGAAGWAQAQARQAQRLRNRIFRPDQGMRRKPRSDGKPLPIPLLCVKL